MYRLRMTSAPRHISRAIEPRYAFRRNSAVRLFNGLIMARGVGHPVQAPGTLEIGWFPSPALKFRIEAFVAGTPEFLLSVRGAVAPVEAGYTEARESFPRGISYTAGSLHQPMRRGREDVLDAVIFHVANFPAFRGSPVARPKIDNARLSISADGWHIDLDCVSKIEDTIKGLRAEGGFALTHVGRLSRSDGSTFTADAAFDAVDSVAQLLSFGRSALCWPFAMVGLDAAKRVVWRTYDRPNVAPWRNELRWFTPADPAGLGRAFDGIRRRWQDPHQRDVLKRAIYLLGDASARGVEPGLIIAQAILELMAWELIVNETRAVSGGGFGTLTAADQMRLLLTSLGIPTAIPPALSDLVTYAKANSGLDGPDVLTNIRNRWAHPPRKGPLRTVGPEQVGAWQLALWYADLVLLHWLGFTGRYAPRVWPGTVEDVPWS